MVDGQDALAPTPFLGCGKRVGNQRLYAGVLGHIVAQNRCRKLSIRASSAPGSHLRGKLLAVRRVPILGEVRFIDGHPCDLVEVNTIFVLQNPLTHSPVVCA